MLLGISHVSHGDENSLDFRVKRLEQVYPEPIYPPIRRHHVLTGCPKNYFQTVGAKQHRSSGNKVEIGAGERHPLPQEFYTESNGNGELGQGRSGQDY